MRNRSLLSFAALLAFAMPVHAIPPPPPQPDPAAVIEADKLAGELLVALDETSLQSWTSVAVSREALSWLATVHPDVWDPTVRETFYVTVQIRVDAVWAEERSNIDAAVANQFRLMSATDLIAVRGFIASPAGQSFRQALVGSYSGLADRAAFAVLYRRVFPEFPGLLDAAQKPAAE